LRGGRLALRLLSSLRRGRGSDPGFAGSRRRRGTAPRFLGGELPEGQRQVAQEAGKIELFLPFVEAGEGRGDPLERAAADLLRDPREVREQSPLRFQALVDGRGERQRAEGLFDVATDGVA
jgi:hypothetical protein